MATTGLDVFDKTLHETNQWLKEIMGEIGPERQVAYRALAAVLHALRDRLPVDDAAHLAAQLPILARGIFFDQWRPTGKPERIRAVDDFLARIAGELADLRPLDPERVARAVFGAICRHVSAGEADKVGRLLPEAIRRLWPQGAAAASLAAAGNKPGAGLEC